MTCLGSFMADASERWQIAATSQEGAVPPAIFFHEMKSKTALNPSNNLQYQPHRLIDGPSCDVAMLWLPVGQLSNPLQISLGVLEVERLDYRSMDLVVARGPRTMTWCSFRTNRWPTANVWRGMKGLGSVEWASNLVSLSWMPWSPMEGKSLMSHGGSKSQQSPISDNICNIWFCLESILNKSNDWYSSSYCNGQIMGEFLIFGILVSRT